MKKINIFILFSLLMATISCNQEMLDVYPKGEVVLANLSNKDGVELLLLGAYSALDGQNVTIMNRNDLFGNAALSFSDWLFGSMQSDDAYKGSSAGDQTVINFIEGYEIQSAGNTLNVSRWKYAYDGITRCNDVIKAAISAEDMTEDEKNAVIAQARFLRGHFYCELTISYINVPWIDENTIDPAKISNDHIVWPEIQADFEYAAEHLPSRWSSGSIGRATSWAAKTYLARVYMYQNDYASAKPILNDVYTNGGYTLMNDFQFNFDINHRNNEESIFEDQRCEDGLFFGANAGFGDFLNYPVFGPMASGYGFFQPSYSLVSAFFTDPATGLPIQLGKNYQSSDMPTVYDATDVTVVKLTEPIDPRLDFTVGRPGVPFKDWGIQPATAWIGSISNGGPFLNKKNMFGQNESNWFRRAFGGKCANNFRKLRLDHVILWLAECEVETGGDLNKAMNLVNEIRTRAKNSSWLTYTQVDIEVFEAAYPKDAGKFTAGEYAGNYKIELYTSFPNVEYARNAVRMEQRLEFGMEGIRFFDLVRWGEAADVLQNYINVESTRMGHLQGKIFNKGVDEYLPIPQEQIDLYPEILMQNDYRD